MTSSWRVERKDSLAHLYKAYIYKVSEGGISAVCYSGGPANIVRTSRWRLNWGELFSNPFGVIFQFLSSRSQPMTGQMFWAF
jgi:hypothetical protein